jgi:hypothetical protein
MEFQLLNEFLTPSHLLWLGTGLQLVGALVCWFVAEALAGTVGKMRTSPWPMLRERTAPPRYAETAPVLRLRGPVLQREGFAASAMIERDAA